jgi:diazepam-binding inhibitor (GABA receptor modulating acyl-CoA-binding protein)
MRVAKRGAWRYFAASSYTLLLSSMTTQPDFEAAAQRAQQLPAKPSNTVLLQLYALYKQATEGDATGPRPGGFDFKAISKYDAWHQLAGLSKDAARQQYVELVNELAG